MRFFNCLLASVAVFYACGDDASSANDSSGVSDDSRYEHVTINTENRTIAVNTASRYESYCVLNKGTFSWGDLFYEPYSETVPSRYVTRGDTLVVYFNGNMDDPHYYIGGSTEMIYGEWKNLECGEYNGKLECVNEDDREFRAQYSELVLMISENKFQEEVVYKPAYFEYDDYMNSWFMHELYGIIQNGDIMGGTVSLKDLLEPVQPSHIKDDETIFEIEVLESSKRDKKFKMKGKEYEFKVTKTERDSLDYTIAVSVSSEGKECSYEERQVNVTKDNCKDLTTDGLLNYDEDRDFQDSLYIKGTVVIAKDAHEFGECLLQLH